MISTGRCSLAFLGLMAFFQPAFGAPTPNEVMKLSVHRPNADGWWIFGKDQTHALLKDKTVSGGLALSIRIDGGAQNTWDDQAGASAEQDLKKGNTVFLAFWARAETPPAKANAINVIATVQRSDAPYTIMASTTPSIGGSDWQLYCASGTAPSDFKAGNYSAVVQVATGRQTLDLGPVFILVARTAADRKLISSGCAGLKPVLAAVPITPPSIAELKKRLEKILADTHTPGLSVAIVRKDGPEWIAGLGKADVAANRSTTPDTLFRIGSVSKTFAALAVLKLVNEGKLSLQNPVHKLVPEIWFENRWEASDPVRVVDLLEHTTGWDDMPVRNYGKSPVHFRLRDQLQDDHTSRISRWRPGTRMAYCNSGPSVAAYIVEKITGQRFEDYVAKNFFAPMGMKTATYFRPVADIAATLYHSGGKKPYPYWEIFGRPASSINASANDMANLLTFYLNRGNVRGTQIMPAASVDRMEVPTRSLAAREGLKLGYGLSNFTGMPDNNGLIFHGHDGGLPGGLTELAYLPNDGVGYFFSINSGNGVAWWQIGKAIRDYVALGMWSVPMPKTASLPANAQSYAGWYEPASPRIEMTHFQERLLGLSWIRVRDGKLLRTSLQGWNEVFVPVSASFLRRESNPNPSLALLAPNTDGLFVQLDTVTMKHIPRWLALGEILLCAWVALAMGSVLLYAPFWLLTGLLSKKRRRPQERWLKIWPLVAVLSFIGVNALSIWPGEDVLTRLGNLTLWSGGIWLGTIVIAVASVAAAVALWRAREVRSFVYGYSLTVTLALLILTTYLATWGVIGLRTWA